MRLRIQASAEACGVGESSTNASVDVGVSAKFGVGFDLFCGTGTISSVIASKLNRVIGIEIIEDAVIKARENARLKFHRQL